MCIHNKQSFVNLMWFWGTLISCITTPVFGNHRFNDKLESLIFSTELSHCPLMDLNLTFTSSHVTLSAAGKENGWKFPIKFSTY